MSQRENLPKSDQALSAGDPETSTTSLRRGTLGLVGIIFFVVAASAPLAGMTGAFPVAAVILGPGAVGMYVFVGIVLLLFSVGYATMSHYVTNTGAFSLATRAPITGSSPMVSMMKDCSVWE